jgi:cytochrome c biogenesis protein CcmG/thiol:disulfide interchange protein DsbE
MHIRALPLTSALLAVPLLAVPAFGQEFIQFRNQPMPQFVITTVAGKKLTNNSLKGKIVLFDFWATWCGPCKMASPAMQKLAKAYQNKGVVVIGADTFEQGPNSRGPGPAKGYAAEHKYSYLFTFENDGLAHSLGITSIPAFALVDKKGVVRAAVTGLPRVGGADALYSIFSKKIDSMLKS